MTDGKVEIRVILHRPCIFPPVRIGTIKVEKSSFGRLTKVCMCKKCGLFYKPSLEHRCEAKEQERMETKYNVGDKVIIEATIAGVSNNIYKLSSNCFHGEGFATEDEIRGN